MKITNLKLTNFRNYENLNLHFSNYKNIIIGNNGLGKTNIVEAIYYLSITKSFRTNNQEVLIRENSDFAVIEATVLNKIKNKYRVVITKDGKKIKIDNQEITKLSDYISVNYKGVNNYATAEISIEKDELYSALIWICLVLIIIICDCLVYIIRFLSKEIVI